MKLLQDRVLIKRNPQKEFTESGIYLPEDSREIPQQGTVSFVGVFVKELKVGDIVLFGRYNGENLEIDNQKLVLLREHEIYAKVKK